MAGKQTNTRQYTLEGVLGAFFTINILIIFSLLCVLFYTINANLLLVVTVLFTFVGCFGICFYLLRNAILNPFYSLSAMLEAVRHEDYSLRANPKFSGGVVKVLSDEVAMIARDLSTRKLHYDQQAVLVLNLIEQLATPIGIFDQQGRLQHGNEALSNWCGKPWHSYKMRSANALGLFFNGESWQFKDQHMIAKWQIRYSQFAMQNEQSQLVILTNIEQLVSQTEQVAWHKMTRVLSHEINNSLSPIKSLAQSLIDLLSKQLDDQNVSHALDVIVQRSSNLMQFVNRYASLTQEFDVDKTQVDLQHSLEQAATLFDYPITISGAVEYVYADPVLLEQVIVNLIKNAIEASPDKTPVTITSLAKLNAVEITVSDSGVGLANIDNLFVPFYTTKQNGKGIGLSLCRNMIEQQQGRLTLENRSPEQGAVARIILPNQRKK